MLPLLLALLLSGCAEEEPDILEKIAAAPIARMECAEDEEGYLLDTVELQSLAAMDIRATEGSFTGDWVYCFTFYPREVCPNEREILVLFGEKSLCIDGTLYVPADGGSYASILEWAKNKYEYFILILNKTVSFY